MKMRIKKIMISGLILGVSFILPLCVISPTATGIANPAAVYCEGLGYEYIIEPTEGGETGFCKLPDGELVDAWQFLKGKVGQEYSYCSQQGYELKTVKDTRTCAQFGLSECSVCVLEDGTEVEVTELMGLELSNPKCYRIPTYLIIIIAVAAVALIILVIMLIRRRKTRIAARSKE